MLVAFITFLGVVGLVALTGFFLLTPPDDIIMGQAEATQVRISGKVPGRIEGIVSVKGWVRKRVTRLSSFGYAWPAAR